MRRTIVFLLSAACVVISVLIIDAVSRVFSMNSASPAEALDSFDKYRLVLISQEMDSPFWIELEEGANAAAVRHDISLEAWKTFGLSEPYFLKNFEIAIASKVDGIIVQGLDTDAFNNLTARATTSGIPVITVASDVPAGENLRKTYVGTNHYEAGRLVAEQMLADMGGQGTAVMLVGDRQQHYQRERLRGIMDVIGDHPVFTAEIAVTGNTNDEVTRVTRQVLNDKPDARGFVSVAYNNAGVIAREISRRYRHEEFFIYSFDETPDTMNLLQSGVIDALIAQDPRSMGELSVELMVRWLEGQDLPLRLEGYYTDIHMLRAEDL